MPKNSVTDWSETASDNTDIGGIDIDEGCAPSGMNNAARTTMAQIKAFFKSTVFRLRDSTDQTKLLAFNLSGLTTATTRTLTVPDASGLIYTDASPVSGFRNKFINGDYDVWQRATSQTASGYRSADRWELSLGSGASVTLTRVAHTLGQTSVPGNPRYYMSFARSVAGTATSYIGQKIEGVSTLAGRKVTLTFYAKAAAATTLDTQYSQNFGTGGAPSAVVAASIQTFNLTTAWQKCSVAFDLPSIAGKTLGTGGNDNLEISLRRAFNSTNPTTTIDVSHVSLVEGDATDEADAFSPRHIQQEEELCRRYFFSLGGDNLFEQFGAGVQNLVTAAQIDIKHPVPMRAAPTFSFASGSCLVLTNNGAGAAVTTITGSTAKFITRLTVSAAGTAGHGAILISDNTLNTRLWFDAEL